MTRVSALETAHISPRNAALDPSEPQVPHVAGVQRKGGDATIVVSQERQFSSTPTKAIAGIGNQVDPIPAELELKAALPDLERVEEVELVAVEITREGLKLFNRQGYGLRACGAASSCRK